MHHIRHEIKRIEEAMLLAETGGELFNKLSIARQALKWAVNPNINKSIHDEIMEEVKSAEAPEEVISYKKTPKKRGK